MTLEALEVFGTWSFLEIGSSSLGVLGPHRPRRPEALRASTGRMKSRKDSLKPKTPQTPTPLNPTCLHPTFESLKTTGENLNRP